MIRTRKNNDKLLIGILLFIAFFLAKLPILNMPIHWDAIQQIVVADRLKSNNLNPESLRNFWIYEGRPLFFYELLALSYLLLGVSLWVPHLLIIIFGFIALYFTYLLGENLYSKKVGIIASLFLFFSAIFFAQTGIVTLMVPFTALTLTTLYFAIKNRIKAYLISGTLLVMTLDIAPLLILLILFYVIYRNHKKEKIKNILLYSIPLFVFVLWMTYNKLVFGWFLFTRVSSFPNIVESWPLVIGILPLIENFVNRLQEVFIYDYKWILTVPLILLSVHKIANRKFSVKLEIVFLFSVILSYLLSFSLMKEGYLIRYALMVYPLFFLLVSNSLNEIVKNKLAINLIVIIIIILFVSTWVGNRTENCGCKLESNLEYLDLVKTHYETTNYIEKNYPNLTVLTAWPQTEELSMPILGYVSKPIKIIPIYHPNLTEKMFGADLVYYSPQSDLYQEQMLLDIMKNLNLTLLTKFEQNGKYTEIYRIKK